jgi:hypothetical protein
MLKEINQHKGAYLILVIGLVVFAVAYLNLWPDAVMERIVIAALAVGYFIWGILTHVKTKRLTAFVIQEYAAVALLGALVLLLLTF